MKDKVFEKPIAKQFEFDADVAAVFDDMLERSVPFYKTSLQLTKQLVLEYLSEGGRLYDLGCSTSTTLLEIERDLKVNAELIGIDNAKAMLQQAQRKIEVFGSSILLEEADILTYQLQRCDAVISNYTLQFIRPLIREEAVRHIATALKDDGIFVFSEKVISDDRALNKKMIDIYHAFKLEQGYSTYEIMHKREALENVLIPYSEAENIKMATRNGFRHCEVLFRWANFATFIALK
jgi:tRNA (cmo5U34)-methyltransferase